MLCLRDGLTHLSNKRYEPRNQAECKDKEHYESVDALQADLDRWLIYYNTERPHPGYRNQGKRPIDTVNAYLPVTKEAS